MEFVVENTRREDTFILHQGKLTRGWLRIGDKVRGAVDGVRRSAVARAHTGTHLLQNALRTVLGRHVEQAGSLVAPDRLRFDFSHFQALTPEELSRVEELVNIRVMENAEILVGEESFSDAKSKGALTVPGEKYADRVRAVHVGDYSLELCGGTHVRRTGDIGLFVIVSSSAVAAGVRRIEAYTGVGAYKETVRQRTILAEAAAVVRSVPNQLRAKLDSLLEEAKNLKREVTRLKHGEAKKSVSETLEKCRVVHGERIIAEKYDNMSVEELRQLADVLTKKEKCGAALLLGLGADKVSVVLAVRRDVSDAKKADAGAWLRDIAARAGGTGGGRAEMAQGGFKDAGRADTAIQRFWELVEGGL
jgi:alanyl-tRNA synthetase